MSTDKTIQQLLVSISIIENIKVNDQYNDKHLARVLKDMHNMIVFLKKDEKCLSHERCVDFVNYVIKTYNDKLTTIKKYSKLSREEKYAIDALLMLKFKSRKRKNVRKKVS